MQAVRHSGASLYPAGYIGLSLNDDVDPHLLQQERLPGYPGKSRIIHLAFKIKLYLIAGDG